MDTATMIDARGLSCPEPVLRTRRAIASFSGGHLEVLVDSVVACENVARTAEKEGFSVTIQKGDEGGFCLVLTK